MNEDPADLLQGTVDVLILRTLAWKATHGYAMTQFLRDRSKGDLELSGAALYQALHRLERRRLIRSHWGTSEANRRVRVYELTARGREELVTASDNWRRYAAAVSRVLAPA
ncbi:MAG TPA: PadR family transcriptional regulator [Gemmatimonadaceae bacterium]|nr:PadR family transcriptional regulator [Gemmatimonadaceae bacterium]